NSSGTTFSKPSACLKDVQPPSASATRAREAPITQAFCSKSRSPTSTKTPLIRRFPPGKQAVNHHQPDADADCRIGEIEGRPMPPGNVEIEEIDDRATPQPVDDIADGAADDQADRQRQQRHPHPPKPDQQGDDDDGGDRAEDQGVERGAVVEEPEAHAAVPGENEVEEIGAAHAPPQRRPRREKPQHQIFAELIGECHEKGGAETEPHAHFPAGASASTAAAQRRQRSSCCGTVPTSGRTRQQRWHFSPGARLTRTPTPGTSGRVKLPAGGGAAWIAAAEVMQSSAR